MQRPFIHRLLCGTIAALALATASFAQVASTGAVSGTVKDSSGASLPSVTVTITNQGTGVSRTVATDNTGVLFGGSSPPELIA